MPDGPIPVVGIAGPSCGGKTVLARALAGLWLERRPVLLSLDDYYASLGHLPPAERAASNFDHPDALDWDLLLSQVKDLLRGRPVECPLYDFAVHTRRPETRRLSPGGALIVEGLHALGQPLADILTVRVFLDLDEETCLARRLARDTSRRGRTPQSVRAQFRATVRPMYLRHVLPARAGAHLVLRGDDPAHDSARVIDRLVNQPADPA